MRLRLILGLTVLFALAAVSFNNCGDTRVGRPQTIVASNTPPPEPPPSIPPVVEPGYEKPLPQPSAPVVQTPANTVSGGYIGPCKADNPNAMSGHGVTGFCALRLVEGKPLKYNFEFKFPHRRVIFNATPSNNKYGGAIFSSNVTVKIKPPLGADVSQCNMQLEGTARDAMPGGAVVNCSNSETPVGPYAVDLIPNGAGPHVVHFMVSWNAYLKDPDTYKHPECYNMLNDWAAPYAQKAGFDFKLGTDWNTFLTSPAGAPFIAQATAEWNSVCKP